MKHKIGRPKSKIQRKAFTTTLSPQIILLLKKQSFNGQGPINLLIEQAVKQAYMSSDTCLCQKKKVTLDG